ncbi:MAG: fimbrillin family protein [Bacteroidales bacterium]|nr:fimbrillin family protein [Bacteroidales bacterium]MBQ4013620.1 fimbrillin family protein [Bacteroidales bacterium]
MKRCAIAVLLTLFAGVACNEIERPEEKMVPISFSAAVSDGIATRATGMIGDDASLQAGGFGVFGCYTGLHNYSESDANSSFMYNQKLEWVSGDAHWEYNPVKYWPGEEGHKVSFFAYAPYSECDGTGCIPSCVRYQETADPWVMYRIAEDPAQQVDLLYATPLLDQTKMAVNERLEFTFKHALACVGDNVTISTSATGVTLKEVSIDYTLTAKGRLVLWNRGSANWTPIQSEDVVTVRSVSLLTGGHEPLPKTFSGQGLFCIPAEAAGYPQKATIHVTYVVNNVEHTATSELMLKGLLQEGKTLDINITLNVN